MAVAEEVRPVVPQHMRALHRANEVRLARADGKRQIESGEITVAEVVAEVPWWAESMAVFDLIVAQRRWGRLRALKLLAEVPVSEKKTVGSLTDRQRRALVRLLGGLPVSFVSAAAA